MTSSLWILLAASPIVCLWACYLGLGLGNAAHDMALAKWAGGPRWALPLNYEPWIKEGRP